MDKNIKESQERVSVILPVFNGMVSVRHAIDSVLSQTYKEFRLIVIDDGSTDGTAEIVKDMAKNDDRIYFVQNDENCGIQYTLNRGVGLSGGEYLARIDADDSWLLKDKLQQQVDYLERNPDHVCVGTGAVAVNDQGRELYRLYKPVSDAEIRRWMLGRNCFMHGSVLMRRYAVLRAGGYDTRPERRHVEDYDLWLRLGREGKLANLPIFGMQYGVSEKQITSQNKIEMFKKSHRLIKEFKNDYPNYMVANLRRYIRLFIYGYLRWDGIRKITARFTTR